MLNKEEIPTKEEMIAYCGECRELFSFLNNWLSNEYKTLQKIVFPYGNKYGQGIAHKSKNKLICNVFAKNNSFTVMIRLSNKQFDSIYNDVEKYTKDYIENKYHCSEGGWIHYRIISKENLVDIKKILIAKLSK